VKRIDKMMCISACLNFLSEKILMLLLCLQILFLNFIPIKEALIFSVFEVIKEASKKLGQNSKRLLRTNF